jgi:hypothetical protein
LGNQHICCFDLLDKPYIMVESNRPYEIFQNHTNLTSMLYHTNLTDWTKQLDLYQFWLSTTPLVFAMPCIPKNIFEPNISKGGNQTSVMLVLRAMLVLLVLTWPVGPNKRF